MGKQTVVLTLAGDEADLTRAFDAVGKKADQTADKVVQSGRRMSDAEDGAAQSAKRLESSFERAGEASDKFDTRAMGARDGVTGVQDSMASLSSFAKGDFQGGLLLAGSGLSDLGSAGYNSVIPMTKELVVKFGAAKLAMMGFGVVAAAGAVALLLWARSANSFSADLSHANEDLQRFIETGRKTQTLRDVAQSTDKWSESLNRASIHLKDVFDPQAGIDWLAGASLLIGKTKGAQERFDALDKSVAGYIDTTNDLAGATRILLSAGLTPEQIELAKASGQLDDYQKAAARANERTWDLTRSTEEVAAAYAVANKNLTLLNDTVTAGTDPIFRFRQAQENLTTAQLALNDAIREHGKGSKEAEDAAWQLTEAETALLGATTGMSNVDLSFLDQLQRDGLLSADAVGRLKSQAEQAKSKLDALNGSKINVLLTYQAVLNIDYNAAAQMSAHWDAYGQYLSQQVPHMAEGGTVYKPTLALIGEAGPERVTPLGKSMGTVVINTGGSRYASALMEDVARGLDAVGGLKVVVK